MGYTSYKTKTNKTKTQHRKQRVNLVLTIQRNWLHGIHKLQDEDKQNKNTTSKTESQSSIDNIEKLATWDTQVTRRRQTKQKPTQKTESQSSINSREKLATWDTQVTRRRQTKQKHNIENRESIKN